ncbi:ABC transporter permease [Streptacidiphilus sp. N1-12]|uniref:ABC transporter permease n=2 Tax=Streptacidiphilus alkalitolerans TaxID=3342712 RepID=A0ABV6WGB1_9ACTN
MSFTLPRMRSGSAHAPAPALRELGYWLHRYRRTWRGTVVISVANPLLFLAALGAGLGKLVDRGGSSYLHGHSYLVFIAPGLLAAMAMQTGYIEAAGPVFESAQRRGNYRAAAATPMRPRDILDGHLLFIAFRLLISATAFTVVIAAFGVVGPVKALLLVLAATLTGLAFAAPIAAWSITVTRIARLQAVYRFVLMPLYMFSGTFFSADQLPGWLHAVVACTPLYQGITLCRSITEGSATAGGSAVHLGYLAVLAVVGYLAARRGFAARLHS